MNRRESQIIGMLQQDIEQLKHCRVTKLGKWMWVTDMKEAIRYIRQLERVIRRFEKLVDKRKYRKELIAINYGYERRLEAKRYDL